MPNNTRHSDGLQTFPPSHAMDPVMLHFNRGVVLSMTLYNCLIGTGWFKSESDIWRKIVQSKAKDPSRITPDLQLFKLLNSGSLTVEKMKALTFKYAPPFKKDWVDLSSEDIPHNVGAWWIIKLIIEAVTATENNHVKNFQRKFDALILDEQLAIEDSLQNGSHEVADRAAREWLDIDGITDLQRNKDKQICYVVRQNLVLLALFEHLLRSLSKEFCRRYPKPGSMGFLLPSSEGETLLLSNRKLFDRLRHKISSSSGNSLQPISWNSLYNKIADAQRVNEELSGSDVAAIKRKVERIKAGKTKLTHSNYKTLVRVLDPEIYGTPMQVGEFIAPISEVLTQLQLELKSRQCSAQQIAEHFAYYPHMYKKLDAQVY